MQRILTRFSRRNIFYSLIALASLGLAILMSKNLYKLLFAMATFVSFSIALFESIFMRDLKHNYFKIKHIYKLLFIVLERFFKIFIPLFTFFIICMIFTFIKYPQEFIINKSMFHLITILFFPLILIFSIYSILNLDYRQKQIHVFDLQLWEANNIADRRRDEYISKIERILSLSFRLFSTPRLSQKSFWLFVLDRDQNTSEAYFKIAHMGSIVSDINIYKEMKDIKIPYFNVDEWINACDKLYDAFKARGQKDSLFNAYLDFSERKNKYASLVGYLYLRNFHEPLIIRSGLDACLVNNNKHLSLFENDRLKKEKTNWKSAIGWNIVWKGKIIGVCLCLNTEKYGFRPSHRSIIKFVSNLMAPIIYEGINKGYFGETALDMLMNARDINSDDVVVAKIRQKHDKKHWKKEIIALTKICKKMIE